MLRDYQQAATDAALDWVRKSVEPCVLDLATGAGKSHIIAAIADQLHKISKGKHVLCLAPSAELVTQNREKYLATGNPASVYSASAGSKCLHWPVVFGTPGTVKRVARKLGSRFCAVIIDECHGITPTIKTIIDDMRKTNPNLRVIGLSATPYRLGTGYIYRADETGKPMAEHESINPYFAKLLYRVKPHYLISLGYLTRPVISRITAQSYDTSGLLLNSRGQFDAADIDKAFVGHGRKTAAIVADVIDRCENRKGVMFFAATIRHADEIMASLPPAFSALITGATSKTDREKIISKFKAKKIKYLVNVAVLTTGFDAPHVDAIALLRATESVGLLQQIVGRGLRIDDGKRDCMVLDYAGNIERHCPDGDIFSPTIETKISNKGDDIEAKCPQCNIVNTFTLRPNPDGYGIDKNGYFVDENDNRILAGDGHMPAHFGRRCMAEHPAPGGKLVRCDYRWTMKICPACEQENDIAARYCSECKTELVDPNEKLINDFKSLKKDPKRLQTDRVISWFVRKTVSIKGNNCVTVNWITEYRHFTTWFVTESENAMIVHNWKRFCGATDNGQTMPKTITYKKNDNGFFDVFAYNEPPDIMPMQ